MNEDVCRICRGEETPDEPLYHPCRCSGSIKYVHQDCLLEWLEHARVRTKCDVCATDYVLRKRYKPEMSDQLPLRDYATYVVRSFYENCYIIFYVIRAVLMVSSVAMFTKYILEYMVLSVEHLVSGPSPSSVKDFYSSSWSELRSRMKQTPPRQSLVPMLDTAMSLILPESEFRSAWINGMLLLSGFICFAIFGWMMAMWVLNEHALLHDLEHIELGEISHMDQGDDEDLLADLHPHNANSLDMHGHLQEGQAPVEETVVELPSKSDLFEDLRPENVVRLENEQLDGDGARLLQEEEEDVEELGPFFRRIIVDLFGGPNNIVIPGFITWLVFFGSITLIYQSIYWPSLVIKDFFLFALVKLLKTVKAPSAASEAIKWALGGMPQSVLGHLTLIITVQSLVLTTIRLTILYNMQMLLRRSWGKNLVIIAYQVYAVLKTLLMTIIETFVFPQFCGILLHVAVLPITSPWSWHWQQYREHPYWNLFLQWLSGYLYMHGFQIFVSACRRLFRKGVLFFLHDNDPVYFMRSIMLLSLPKQLHRISISASIYGAFIIFGIGSVCLLLRVLEPSTWPLNLTYWPGASCLRLWPLVVIFSSLSVPLTRSGKKLKDVLSLWLSERVWLRMFSFIAKKLDFESWLFAVPRTLTDTEAEKLNNGDKSAGYFVRAPVDYPPRTRHSLNLFTPVTKDNVRLDGKTGIQPNELTRYTLVWRPPHFSYRLALLALCSWVFITGLTLMFTLIPMQLGRLLDYTIFNNEIRNDLILTLAGLTICLPTYAEALRRFAPRELELCVRFMSIFGNLPQPSKSDALSAAFWAVAFATLSLNPHEAWNHWLVFFRGVPASGSSSASSQILVAVVNLIAYFVGNLYSSAWCNAIATADFFIWQVILEIAGVVPKSNSKVFGASLALASYRLWEMWCVSKSAKQLSESVRETMYLDAIEVENYQQPEPAASPVHE